MNLLLGLGAAMMVAAPSFGTRVSRVHSDLMRAHLALDERRCASARELILGAQNRMLRLEAKDRPRGYALGALLDGFNDVQQRYGRVCA